MHMLTKEQIMIEQKDWPENDRSKDKDFSQYEFWLVADDGQSVGADSIEELDEYFSQGE